MNEVNKGQGEARQHLFLCHHLNRAISNSNTSQQGKYSQSSDPTPVEKT